MSVYTNSYICKIYVESCPSSRRNLKLRPCLTYVVKSIIDFISIFSRKFINEKLNNKGIETGSYIYSL